ncbi:hypothetical protein BT93_F0672 [Corymbia citriodora subsp. variegata]|nr:hypothetical protein BT93_F0672 [Corymbia citriodora subsp. variegata]
MGLDQEGTKFESLSLAQCYGITTTPNFSKCLFLERLTLARCYWLKTIESFIGDLQLLIKLEIEDCMSLIDLPEEVGALVKLKHFSLQGCFGLRELPHSFGNLTSLIELDLSETGIKELPNFIGKLKSLRVLRLLKKQSSSPEHHVWQLPSGISMLKNLEVLDLSGRIEMKSEIPVETGELPSLRILNLECTCISKMPRTINMLHHLWKLDLRDCHAIQGLPELPISLRCLLLQSKSLLSVPDLSNLTNLVELLLSDGSHSTNKSNLITRCNLRWIGRLSRLKTLYLNLLNVPVPSELASLSHLKKLTLSHLDLETLVQLPSSLLSLNLKYFSIRWAKLLPSYLRLRNLSTLVFCSVEVDCIPFNGLPLLENLTVMGCKLLGQLSIPLEFRKLRLVRVFLCPELVEIQVMGLLKSPE